LLVGLFELKGVSFVRGIVLPGIVLLLASVLLPACGGAPEGTGNRTYVATIPPVGMILRELTHGRAEVLTLVSGAASPHTYEPRPSDARNASDALAMFYAADDLDGWAAKLPSARRFALMPQVPEAMLLPGDVAEALHAEEEHDHDHDHDNAHSHGVHDPHVWSDPKVVEAMLPGLVADLSACDPEGAVIYAANAKAFAEQLQALDAEIAAILAPVRDKPVILLHLSMQYFLHRYGLKLAAVVEPSPGKETTPRFLEGVIAVVRSSGAKVVFTEPQLPKRPAEAVAQAAGVAVAELDPYGGLSGRETYAALLRYNANALRTALE